MNLIEQDTCLTPNYRTIPLTQDQFAIVDVADYAWLSQRKWYACWYESANTFYARRDQMRSGRKRPIYMHREILGTSGSRSDHRDGNGLHNWRANLRSATPAQNGANQRIRSTNKSGYKGVSKHACGKWIAQITAGRKNAYLGLHDTPELAARAYDAKSLELHGEFGRLNFPH